MILLDNQTECTIDTSLLEKVVAYLKITKDIELIITDNITIQNYNSQYRGIDRATDVLSFPLEDIEYMPLGSIIISIEKVKELAKSLQHPADAEITLLFIHGLLHLLGYDHETDNGEMREMERRIISNFKLPKSLIVRTQGD